MTHLLFHATGQDLSTLVLTECTSPSGKLPSSRVLACRDIGRVFEVDAATVDKDIFVVTRQTNRCSLFVVQRCEIPEMSAAHIGNASEVSVSQADAVQATMMFRHLGSHEFQLDVVPTSVKVNPYIAGECLIGMDTSCVSIWSVHHGIERSLFPKARFNCFDGWTRAYYAGHPRQVVIADRTVVQLVDHRDGFRSSVDLFALPSDLAHSRERVMTAHVHGSLDFSFLHAIATNYSVFLIDQRFPGSPVMQWHPDTLGPITYLHSLELPHPTNEAQCRALLLAGSQHPAEVMCYPFSHGGGRAVIGSGCPRRLSMMTDIFDANRFLQLSSIYRVLLHDRIAVSLCGLSAVEGWVDQSWVSYQVNCFGEIFYQQHFRHRDSDGHSELYPSTLGGLLTGEATDSLSPSESHLKNFVHRLHEHIESSSSTLDADVQSGIDDDCPTVEMCCVDSFSRGNPDSVRAVDDVVACFVCKDCTDLRRRKEHGGKLTCSLSGDFSVDADSRSHDADDCSYNMQILDGVVPDIDNYPVDVFTNIHLKLMAGKAEYGEDFLGLVDERVRDSWLCVEVENVYGVCPVFFGICPDCSVFSIVLRYVSCLQHLF